MVRVKTIPLKVSLKIDVACRPQRPFQATDANLVASTTGNLAMATNTPDLVQWKIENNDTASPCLWYILTVKLEIDMYMLGIQFTDSR